MKLFIAGLMILAFFSENVIAQTTESKRRIEEEKRINLIPSESRSRNDTFDGLGDHLNPSQTYFLKILDKDKATFADTCAILVILSGYSDRYNDFISQRDFLEKNKILPPLAPVLFNDPEALLHKGEAAYMLCKLLKIRGGIWMRLFGINPRYAFKELVYKEIMLPGSADEFLSGKDLVFSATQAALFLAGHEGPIGVKSAKKADPE